MSKTNTAATASRQTAEQRARAGALQALAELHTDRFGWVCAGSPDPGRSRAPKRSQPKHRAQHDAAPPMSM